MTTQEMTLDRALDHLEQYGAESEITDFLRQHIAKLEARVLELEEEVESLGYEVMEAQSRCE